MRWAREELSPVPGLMSYLGPRELVLNSREKAVLRRAADILEKISDQFETEYGVDADERTDPVLSSGYCRFLADGE